MTLTKQDKENMTIKVRKTDPHKRIVYAKISDTLNLAIINKINELKLAGRLQMDFKKTDYIARCIEAGHRSLNIVESE